MTETARDGRQSQADNSGYFVCWGCGEFGQHCHGSKQEVTFQDGCVEKFCGQQAGRVKHVGCGSSHTVVVTSKFVTFFIFTMHKPLGFPAILPTKTTLRVLYRLLEKSSKLKEKL